MTWTCSQLTLQTCGLWLPFTGEAICHGHKHIEDSPDCWILWASNFTCMYVSQIGGVRYLWQFALLMLDVAFPEQLWPSPSCATKLMPWGGQIHMLCPASHPCGYTTTSRRGLERFWWHNHLHKIGYWANVNFTEKPCVSPCDFKICT